jgi:hypothetical protein
MYVLMQSLLTRMTALPAQTVVEWQLPGLLCGIAVGAAIMATRWILGVYAPPSPQWQQLIAEVAIGGLAYLAFIKFNRFAEVRKMLRDVAEDLSPSIGAVVRVFV